ncbi:uncharacterized protein LOC127136402 [Lathyrus oleraceus]|uniref:uncharacterized protein LOC127136402 n=1 Tax=Pisum sativum TaxID=3888 RepID=UPI0021CE9473|nr:uncharacterized protein LOC127136402 [Pisum sativum]
MRRQYELLQMGGDEKIAGYVSKVQNLVHLMKDRAIQESNNIETMKLEDLVGSLEANEIRIVERKWVQDSLQALQAQAWKKHGGSNKFKGKRDKTLSNKSWLNPQKRKVDDRASESLKRGEGNSYQKDKEKKSVQCYNCEKLGHLAKNYFADNHADSKIRFLDLDCWNHMTSQKVWLVDFDLSKKSKVNLVDDSSLQVEGTGNIVIQRNNGGKAMMKYVLNVHGIKCNMLSVEQLVKKGFSVIMKDGALELFDIQNNLVLKYPLSNNKTFKTMISSTEV